jgi:hypothetical protein
MLPKGTVRELSGVVESRKYPGVFWAHGDSGSDPEIVAFNLDGEVLARVEIAGAPNTDWEDIAVGDQGNLYIGDIGNNLDVFPVRYVYEVREPDPHHPPQQPVPYARRMRFVYPDKQRFDAEALFWHAGHVYLVPKQRSNEAPIYRLDPADEDNVKLTKVAQVPAYYVTAAAVSADGTKLALCGYSGVRVYAITGRALDIDVDSVRRVAFPVRKGYEACCFDNQDLIITNEYGLLYRVTADDIANETRFSAR